MFDIYYSGEITPSEQLESVKAKVKSLFNAGDQKMTLLFSGDPCPVKLGVDKVTADKYRRAMLNVGAIAIVLPAGQEPEFTSNPFLNSASNSNPTPEHKTDAPSQATTDREKKATERPKENATATIANVGEGFLAEQPEFIERSFDFSEYSLASSGSQIDTNDAQSPPPAPNTDHLTLQ
jgi:hypothetical protein